MALIITAAAPAPARRGATASASASDSSGEAFAGVLAGTPKSEDGDSSKAAVSPHRLGKPHPLAKFQKVRAEDERSSSDTGQAVDANRMPEALAPRRDQDVAGHRAKPDEASSSTVLTVSDGTAAAGSAAPNAASAEGESTAAIGGVAVATALAGVTAVTAVTANARVPIPGSNAAGAATAGASLTGSVSAAGPLTASGPAAGAPAASASAGTAEAAAVAETAQLAGVSGLSTVAGGPSRAGAGPVATAVSGAPVAVKGGTGNGEPAPGSFGSTGFTTSMLASLHALGTDVPGLGWVGGVHADTKAAAAQVSSDAGTAPGLQGSHSTNTHSAVHHGSTVDAAPAEVPAQTPAAQAPAANASAANASAANASAGQAAGQLAQPVPAAGLQAPAGLPHAMTSTPAQVWTAAEPLGPQLTSSVLPLRAGGDGSHQLIIALHPEQLGPVNVHVRITGDAMTIQLASGTQDAHETLRAALPELRHELQAAGLGTAQLSLDGGGTAAFSGSGGQRDTFRNGRSALQNPVVEPVALTARASVPRTSGVSDSGLDRWL